MAKRKKSKKITIKKSKNISAQTDQDLKLERRPTLFEQLRLGESYISLVLGAIVVLTISIIFFVLVRGNHSSESSQTANKPSLKTTVTVGSKKVYVLKEGEGLWDVAVKFYGDGYRWTQIANANKLGENADYLEPGTKLIIPPVK